eukprot:10561162-Prorocentrum_lima.AAC.1
MQHRSYNNNKMIEDYLQFFYSRSSLPSSVTAVSTTSNDDQSTIDELAVPLEVPCGKRTGVYLIYGHPKCKWEHTLQHEQNRRNWERYTMESLS